MNSNAGGNSLKNTDLDGLGGELSGAAEALDGDDSKSAKAKMRKASGKIRDFALLKNRNWRLAKLLSECQACKAGIAGVCSGEGITRTNALSKGPSNRAGKSTSANQFGELTSIDASLNLEHVTGVQGDGPSTVQTTKASAEGQQSAVSYKDAYTKYQKLSEDALTEEQIPLGYKFYVKRYFEAIKPSDEQQPAANDGK